MLVLPAKTQEFSLTPAGNHLATCYRFVDIGTQKIEWQGKVKFQHKIIISWELPDELMEDGRPYSMHQRYTLSSHDKGTLRQHLESWRGKPFTAEEFGSFDIGKLIGHSCLLNIVHAEREGKTYANLKTVGALPKGMMKRALINEPLYFALNDFKQDVYDKLSQSLQAIIAMSPEYQELKGVSKISEHVEDQENYPPADIPYDAIPF